MKYVSLLLLTVGCLSFSQNKPAEPMRFRGAYLGEPLSDFADCSSGKAKSLKDGYKSHGQPCKNKGVMFHERAHFLAPDEGERYYFESGVLYKIQILVPNTDWEKVRFDLTQKLGDPISEVPQVYQNSFGAKWEYGQGFWLRGDIVASAGIKVLPVHAAFGGGNATNGIQITITSADRAKLPSNTPSTLD